jgi:hypothetical protein
MCGGFNMIRFLCETAEKQGINVNLTSIFTFIGMAFSIIVSVVALVWLTCFVVRLLIKTFKKQVQSSYDIFVENSEAKAKSKKERNAIKRQAKDARKLEILNMKQEYKARIHQMKVDKLGIKLMENEEKVKERLSSKKSKENELTSVQNEKSENEIKDQSQSENKTNDGNKEKKDKK